MKARRAWIRAAEARRTPAKAPATPEPKAPPSSPRGSRASERTGRTRRWRWTRILGGKKQKDGDGSAADRRVRAEPWRGVLAAAPAEPLGTPAALGSLRYETAGRSPVRHARRVPRPLRGARRWRTSSCVSGRSERKALVLLMDAALLRRLRPKAFFTKKRRRREKDEKDAFVATNRVVSNASRALRAARLRRRAESCRLACVEHASLTVRTMMPVTTWFPYFSMRAPASARRKRRRLPSAFFFWRRRTRGACARASRRARTWRSSSARLRAPRRLAGGRAGAARDVPRRHRARRGQQGGSAAELAAVGNECRVPLTRSSLR